MATHPKTKNGIYKLGDAYYIRIKVNGVRIRKSFGPNRKEAELALAEIRAQRALARVRNDYSGLEHLLMPKCTTTFAEAAQSYMEQRTLKHSSKIPDAFWHLFTCLAWTGARPGELRALRWRDVDWQRNEIKISKARYKSEESTTKTKSSRRVIEMFPPVRAALEQLRMERGVIDLDGHVFVKPDGKPMDSQLDHVWARALAKAGLRHRPSYQLRHTFASICLSNGMEPGRLAKMLGHTNPGITLRHYARWMSTGMGVDQRFLNALFGSGAQLQVVGP